MPRKPTPAPVDKTAKVNEAVIADETAAANKLALATREQDARVAALAQKLNYGGSTDPAVLENSAQDAIRRMGMAVFELGAYLLLLKEACPHGTFLPTLERLGLSPESALRYMRVTNRFANASTSKHLEAAGVNKLAELLALDNEQSNELTALGQTGELALDDVAKMTVKELRAAVRKERDAREKEKRRGDRLQTVSDELQEEVRLVKRLKPDDQLAKLHQEAGELLAESLGLLQGSVRQALVALDEWQRANGQDQRVVMAGMVGQLQAQLVELRDEFHLRDVAGDGTPEWQAWAQANPIQPHGGN